MTQCVSTSEEGGLGRFLEVPTRWRQDLQLVHLEPEGSGYVACGHTLLNGQRRPVVMKFNGDAADATPQGTAVKEGVALHVTPDNAGGLIVSGFVGDSTLLQDLGAGESADRRSERVLGPFVRLSQSCGGRRPRRLQPRFADPTDRCFSRSSNTQDCIQEASAVLLNGADGQLIWARQLARELTGYTAAWFDQNSSALRRRCVVLGHQSDYADDNWQGMTLMDDVVLWQDANLARHHPVPDGI